MTFFKRGMMCVWQCSPKLDHDPATAHLVRDGAGCARAGKGVEDEVALPLVVNSKYLF